MTCHARQRTLLWIGRQLRIVSSAAVPLPQPQHKSSMLRSFVQMTLHWHCIGIADRTSVRPPGARPMQRCKCILTLRAKKRLILSGLRSGALRKEHASSGGSGTRNEKEFSGVEREETDSQSYLGVRKICRMWLCFCFNGGELAVAALASCQPRQEKSSHSPPWHPHTHRDRQGKAPITMQYTSLLPP